MKKLYLIGLFSVLALSATTQASNHHFTRFRMIPFPLVRLTEPTPSERAQEILIHMTGMLQKRQNFQRIESSDLQAEAITEIREIKRKHPNTLNLEQLQIIKAYETLIEADQRYREFEAWVDQVNNESEKISKKNCFKKNSKTQKNGSFGIPRGSAKLDRNSRIN